MIQLFLLAGGLALCGVILLEHGFALGGHLQRAAICHRVGFWLAVAWVVAIIIYVGGLLVW